MEDRRLRIDGSNAECDRRPVAQNCILLRRGFSIRFLHTLSCWDVSRFRYFSEVRTEADCRSAIRQAASLRYLATGSGVWRLDGSVKIRLEFGFGL